MPQSPAFNRNINGLRGACALLVVLHHIWKGPLDNKWFHIAGPLLTACNLVFDSWKFQVEIFFMISGYLIVKTLLRKRDLAEFAIDRILRIYPVFLFIHFLVFAIAPIVHDAHLNITGPGVWLKEFIQNILFLPGMFTLPLAQLAAWSLSYEVTFYLAAGLTFWVWKRSGIGPAAMIGTSLSLVFFWYHPRAIFFLVGVFVYFFEQRSISRIRLNIPLSILLWGALLLLLECAPAVTQSPMPFQMNLLLCGFNIVGAFIGVAYFFNVIHPESSLTFLLRHPITQYLGRISYSLYLWHEVLEFPLKRAILKYLPGASPFVQVAALLALMLPLSILVAHASYEVLEQRLTRRIHRWIDGLRVAHADLALGRTISPEPSALNSAVAEAP